MDNILREAMLIKVSAEKNNNKFYHVVLNADNSLTKRWGRVGTDGQMTSAGGNSIAFDRVVSSKKSRGYKDTGIVSSKTMSTNVDNKADLEKVAKSVLSSRHGDPEIDRVIKVLVQSNAHQILESSGGLIKINDDGIISTPLGILNRSSIDTAGKLLLNIRNPKIVNPKIVEEYLSLVPQVVPRARGWAKDFFSQSTTVEKQKDFLEQLSKSLEWHESEAKAQHEASSDGAVDLAAKYAKLFRSKIDILDPNSKEWEKINKYYKASLKRNHASAHLKLKNVFTLNDEEGTVKYKNMFDKLGNESQLWHGTRAVNVLSILRSGLYVPPTNGGTIQINGRMFGDGIYFSNTSTKSLNYTYGYWNGQKESNFFMFLADVVLGEEYKPVSSFDQRCLQDSRKGLNKKGLPYNSITVEPGKCGVINNEIIVWDTEQINLRYLCEFG